MNINPISVNYANRSSHSQTKNSTSPSFTADRTKAAKVKLLLKVVMDNISEQKPIEAIKANAKAGDKDRPQYDKATNYLFFSGLPKYLSKGIS